MQKPILVTGANGYIGGLCAATLNTYRHNVLWGTRRAQIEAGDKLWVAYGDLSDNDNKDLGAAVAGCETVVHFAGHAHVPETPAAVSAAERININGTERLARACARHGVERIIFVSSALVLAGSRDKEGRIDDACPRSPLSAYARTKAQAETRLADIGAETGLGWVVLRPPMVYGPGSPGNFHRLVRAVDAGIPLPLGRADAAKSFIYVDNLISAIESLIAHPEVRDASFLVSDTEVTSTAEVVRMIADALGRRPRLLPVPQSTCYALGRLVGRGQDIERLFEPFQIKGNGILERLQWRPPVSLLSGISRTVDAWRAAHR